MAPGVVVVKLHSIGDCSTWKTRTPDFNRITVRGLPERKEIIPDY